MISINVTVEQVKFSIDFQLFFSVQVWKMKIIIVQSTTVNALLHYCNNMEM